MSTTNNSPQRTFQRPNRQNLLGRHPAPELYLVGAPIPASPRSPSRWMPPSPSLQHGIDFSFAQWSAGQPIRWLHILPITIRLTGGDTNAAQAVAAVVTELACITGIDLRTGPPLLGSLDPRNTTEQEIYASRSPTVRPAVPAEDQAVAVLRHEMDHALGLGHASRRIQVMHHALTNDAPNMAGETAMAGRLSAWPARGLAVQPSPTRQGQDYA